MRLTPLLAALCPLIALPVLAQEAGPAPVASSIRFVPGQLVERVASSLDRSQHYAVYLPSDYRPDRKWPVLLLLDPRGRALIPMALARESAERHGYLVLSSYNTLSDGSNQPNIDAMAAMLTDAQRLFAVDPVRLYLVGFSGTARVSWEFAFGLRGHVAGIIGFGAGVTPGFKFTQQGISGPIPFVYYGGAGTSDFNYEEMLALDQELDRLAMTHRLQYFDGPHSWPPVRVMKDAIDWMQLQAMRQGLAPKDSAWVDSLFHTEFYRAKASETSGDSYSAFRRYRAIATDFQGVAEVSAVTARVSELEKGAAVRDAIRRQEKMVERNHTYLRKLGRFLEEYRTAKAPPSLDRSLKTLQVAELQKRRADMRDTVAALAAGRLLEHIVVFSSFYEPRDYLEKGDAARALAILALGEAVGPGPGVCYNRARALGMLQRQEEAVHALECWARGAKPRPDEVATDSDLAMLHGHPAFDALVARLRQGPILPAHP
jgi:predicted esterase